MYSFSVSDSIPLALHDAVISFTDMEWGVEDESFEDFLILEMKTMRMMQSSFV
jgi:hypothetical protein